MKTSTAAAHDDAVAPGEEPEHGYVVPLVHVRLPERPVDVAFWGLLGVTAVAGAVELPVAAAVAGGVIIARHMRR